MDKVLASLVATLVVAAGCVQSTTTDALKPRSAFDLSCPKAQLSFTVLGQQSNCIGDDMECATSVGVSGCGKKATYVRANIHGTWVLNSDTTEAAPAAKAAPAPK